ncbi:hypothetical protein [Agrilutibacter solisilvae]|uniref:Lipoprotein n=1 Tax=Agrilutibacter solisilvae TaxID=2763317 RepID=A0A975AQI3_9GAMM|nr:hypothetical protein [Lysobacter solisilvae]QSX76984.1 hypothetical protein I8J32_009130 [Lysobacter solisilvae]
MDKHKLILACLAATALSGCGEAAYRDVSGEHGDLIGTQCVLLETLRAHGVTKGFGPEKKTDFVSIWNPGFRGSEVTFVMPLEAGTRMRVLAARECSNCPFEPMLEYRVELVPEPAEFEGRPAFVRAASFLPHQVRCGQAP